MATPLIPGFEFRDQELGAGGMGRVWHARVRTEHPSLQAGREVAVKVIKPELLGHPEVRERFRREVDLCLGLDHPHLVRALDAGEATVDGRETLYLVLEFVRNETLAQRLERAGRMAEHEVRELLIAMARALEELHRHDVVHRDVKPANIFVASDRPAQLADLGVAHVIHDTKGLTAPGEFLGTHDYAAPEQRAGRDVDIRADLYALGVTAEELLSGERVAPGGERRQPPGRLIASDVSPFLAAVVECLQQKDPNRRFRHPGELLAALEQGDESEWWHQWRERQRDTTSRSRGVRVRRDAKFRGRQHELDELVHGFRAVRNGEGRTVVLDGEAGIGKSRLVDEVVRQLDERGESYHLLIGGNAPGGAATGYGALIEAFATALGADRLEDRLTELLPDGSLLPPAFAAFLKGEPAPTGVAPLSRDSIQGAFAQTLSGLAAERPTLLVIEDLHFGTDEGRALFASLAYSIRDCAAQVLGTCRGEDLTEWIGELDALDSFHHLRLQRLDDDSTRELLDERSGSRLLGEALERSVQRSGGNPYFALEIAGTMEAQGDAPTTAPPETELPERVRRHLQRKLRDLDEDDLEHLQVAALIGNTFDPTLVGEALGEEHRTTLKRFLRLERDSWVREEGEDYVFDHHQLHESLLADLSVRLTKGYHRAIVDVLVSRVAVDEPLEVDGRDAVQILRHALNADAKEIALSHWESALGYLERSHQNLLAKELIGSALASPALLRRGQRLRALLVQTRLARLLSLGELMHASLLEANALAVVLKEDELRCQVLNAQADYDLLRGRSAQAESTAQLSRQIASKVGAHALEAEAVMLLAGARESDALSAEKAYLAVHALATDLQAEETLARAEGNLGRIYFQLQRHEDGERWLQRSLERFRHLADRHGEARARLAMASVAAGDEDLERAQAGFESCRDAFRKLGYLRGQAIATFNLASLSWKRLDPLQALPHAHEVLALFRSLGDGVNEAHAHRVLAQCQGAIGDLGEAESHWMSSLSAARAAGDMICQINALQGLGETLLDRGEAERGRLRLSKCRELAMEVAAQHHADWASVRLASSQIPTNPDQARAALVDLLTSPVDAVSRLASAYLGRLDPRGIGRSAGELTPDPRVEFELAAVLWLVTGQDAALNAARNLQRLLFEKLSEELRERLVHVHPLHAQVSRGRRKENHLWTTGC